MFPMSFEVFALIGAILSVFADLATIVTYGTFKTLLNLPGICLINIVIALLMTSVGFIINIIVTGLGFNTINWLCQSLAVVTHYIWLVAFSWMSLQIIQLMRTFVSTTLAMSSSLPRDRKQRVRIISAYALIGWGLPLLYTGILLYLHFCPDCVLYNAVLPTNATKCVTLSKKELTDVPLFALLCLNLAAILITTTAIIIKRRATRRASKMSKKDEIGTNLLILTKLSVSLGATWIPAGVYAWTRIPIFLFIHVTLYAWSGVIIFALFTCARRVRLLWREKLRSMLSDGGLKSAGNTNSLSSRASKSTSCSAPLDDRKGVNTISDLGMVKLTVTTDISE